jgi:hypothetical protein
VTKKERGGKVPVAPWFASLPLVLLPLLPRILPTRAVRFAVSPLFFVPEAEGFAEDATVRGIVAIAASVLLSFDVVLAHCVYLGLSSTARTNVGPFM